MNIDVSTLPDAPVLLKQLLAKQDMTIRQLTQHNQYLLEQFRLAQQKHFGKSAEGFTGQGELFNEAEEIAAEIDVETETVSYTRQKPTRKPLPKDLPRERVVHDISDSEKVCELLRW